VTSSGCFLERAACENVIMLPTTIAGDGMTETKIDRWCW